MQAANEQHNRRKTKRSAGFSVRVYALVSLEIIMTEKCAYCGKERERSEMTQRTIHYRTQGWQKPRFGRQKWGAINATKVQWYCKDKGCGGYDQMAHEG
jgi:hypothetical protein